KQQRITYTSIEAFPLSFDIIHKLNYAESDVEKDLFAKLHAVAWENEVSMNNYFSLMKVKTTLQELILPPQSFDVVFFDAFAPSKQPELWEIPMLKKIFDALKLNGVFVTYCAKGQLKRDLKAIGFLVETLEGPPGKKEMVRALKIS
ncbi:MAG TPA: MnmC family methyltransferase, partial [Sphingobacteriaceae bacterium]